MSGTWFAVLAASHVSVSGGFVLVSIVLPTAVGAGVVEPGNPVAMGPAISAAIR
jgi:hypothetical protein